MLAALILQKLQEDNITRREAAKRVGVSHTTLKRIIEGSPADVDTLLKLCDWMEIEPADALNSMALKGDNKLVSAIAILVEREPGLAKLFKDAMEDVEKGNLSPDDIREIIAYAAYRLGAGKPKQAKPPE
jgi:transcriptional regulator with XRE-family HTH domain